MDVRALTASIVQCLQPGSAAQRGELGQRLSQLVDATRAMKSGGVEASSLLTHIALVQAQVFVVGTQLSDRERELALESLREALAPTNGLRMTGVHAIVIDHLSRILVPLFAVTGGSLLPEPTRVLAIGCWRQLATAIESVYIPQTHPHHRALGTLPETVTLARYVASYLPPDYLSLVACGLLDNAELSDSRQLRVAALETLHDILKPEYGLLADRSTLQPMFPGVVSALARIALAQKAGDNNEMDASMWRKPSAAVRGLAVDAMRTAIVALYGEPGAEEKEKEGGKEAEWARRARHSESILNTSAEEAEEPDDHHLRLRQVLWRLAGLRRTDHPVLSRALLRLFSAVSLDCAQLRATPCGAVATEACLALYHSVPEYADHKNRLTAQCKDPNRALVVARQLDSVLPMFDRYVESGTESQRLDVLALVAGFASVLPDPRTVVGSWWMARGMRLLLASLKVSLPGTALLITEVAGGSADSRSVQFVLDAYRSVELRTALDEFVDVIARAMGPATVCAQLLALLTAPGEPDALRPAALWLLTRVAPMAASAEMAAVYQPAFQYCVDYFGSAEASSSLKSMDHVLQSCAVLNAISAIVPTIGAAAVYYLDLLLFPLLQIASAGEPVIRDQAQRALSVLADTTGSASIPDLLKGNIDYIVEGCSQQLRLVELHPQVFDILTSSVLLVGQDILVYMDDVVEDSLNVCEDFMDDDVVASSALRFLEVVTRTVAEGLAGVALIEEEKLPVGLTDPDPIGSVLAELDDWDTQAQMSELLDLGSPSEPPEEEKMELTTTVDKEEEQGGSPLAIKIALVAQNFLAAESGAQQLLALKIVQNAVLSLAHTRDLLPLINAVWPALVFRLHDDHFYVTLAACDVVDAVCRLGDAWMRRRVHDDLWPHFFRILRAASSVSVAQRTSDRDLVFRILRTMRSVVRCVPIDDPTAWDLVCLVMRFLESETMAPHVIDLLRDMTPVYGDKIWLILAKLSAVVSSNCPTPDDIPNLGIPAEIKVPSNLCQSIGLL